MVKENNLKCWSKVSGTKDSFACNGRWISISPKHKGSFAVHTMKEGILEILGRPKTREQAEKIRYDYMKRNDGGREGMSMEDFIRRKNSGEFNT